MNEHRTKETFYQRHNVWLSKEDYDFIENMREEQKISRAQALRLLITLGRQNFEALVKGTNIIIIK